MQSSCSSSHILRIQGPCEAPGWKQRSTKRYPQEPASRPGAAVQPPGRRFSSTRDAAGPSAPPPLRSPPAAGAGPRPPPEPFPGGLQRGRPAPPPARRGGAEGMGRADRPPLPKPQPWSSSGTNPLPDLDRRPGDSS